MLFPITIHAQPLHFALISARDSQDAFWGPVEDFAQQAAKQLDIKLTILYTHNSKRRMLKLFDQAKKLNVDAVIFANFGQIATQLMQQSEALKLPILLFNSDFNAENKKILGPPREKFPYWLASLMPDDQQAGYLLGRYLIQQARLKNLADKDKQVQILAINGTITDTPARLRLEGLEKAIKEDGNSKLLQSVHAHWLSETAYYKAEKLLLRYPQAKVYWAASDVMSIAVNDALANNGLQQNIDFLTGGVDWSKEGLAAIQQGKMTNSAGGHFMDGAWAVIILYDYFNGVDLSPNSNYQLHSPMSLISSEEIDLLLPSIAFDHWQAINFRQRSKAINKDLIDYDFSPASVLDELKQSNQSNLN